MERSAYSLAEVAARAGIARPTLYKLIAQGLGPRTFHIGRRRLVSAEAERDWQRMLEARSTERALFARETAAA